jgi:hypothetical protein
VSEVTFGETSGGKAILQGSFAGESGTTYYEFIEANLLTKLFRANCRWWIIW